MALQARQPARGRATAKILGQNAIPLLLELSRSPGWSVPAHLAASIGAQTKVIGATLERLQEAGLVELEETGERAGKTTRRVRLTRLGARVEKNLASIVTEVEGAKP